MPFITFYLEYIYGMQETSQKSVQTYPKDFLRAFFNGQLNKARALVSTFLFTRFFQAHLAKTKYLYHRALARALYLIIMEATFPFEFQRDYQPLEIRFQNRFKVFQNVFFMKRLAYQEYLITVHKDFIDLTDIKSKCEMVRGQFMEAKRSLEMLENDSCLEPFKTQVE